MELAVRTARRGGATAADVVNTGPRTSLGPMTAILLYGDTVRYPAIRHEVPLEIIDPLLVAVRDGRTSILTNSLESARIAETLPDAELSLIDELGFYEMLAERRAARRGGARGRAARRPAVGDRAGDRAARPARRGRRPAARRRHRASTSTARPSRPAAAPRSPAELEGIRRAQRAAERGHGRRRGADPRRGAQDGLLQHDGPPLTAEAVRDAIRAECAAAGAPRRRTSWSCSLFVGRRPRPGLRPAARRPADRDRPVAARRGERLLGRHDPHLRRRRRGHRRDRRAARHRPRGARGRPRRRAPRRHRPRAVRRRRATSSSAPGYPTQRTREPGQTSTTASTSASATASASRSTSRRARPLRPRRARPGDVVAIEPGIEGIEGIGGVRFEDLLLITEDGSETLTDYPYDL